MHSIIYIQRLMFIFISLLAIAFGYAYYFIQHYPPPFTDHLSLDAKVKFVREHINPDEIDTVIIGSSIGLNDLLGSELEKNSKIIKHVVNLSVYGATALEAEQITKLIDAFPNVKRILYSVQYSDFPHEWKFKNFDTSILIPYMRHELNPVALFLLYFKACNNLYFCYERQKTWHIENDKPNKFTYLGFDHTGSIPLHIYGKDIIGHRWRLPQPGIMSPRSFAAVERMAKMAKDKGMHYYIVHQAYRKGLYVKYKKVRDAMEYFDVKIEKVLKKYNGILLKIQPLNLEDKYFADRTHLNDTGSPLVSKKVAQMIDRIEGK